MKSYLIKKVVEPPLSPWAVFISEGMDGSSTTLYFKTRKEAEVFIRKEKEKIWKNYQKTR